MNKEIFIAPIVTKEYIADFRDVKKFYEFCKQCKLHKKTWSCPPFPTTTGNFVDYKGQKIEDFSTATIIGVKINIDNETRHQARNVQERDDLIREIFINARNQFDKRLLFLEQQIEKSMLYYAGPCKFCTPNECARALNKPCHYPEKMRSTLEADGFDISRTTTEILGLELLWCNDLVLPEYYTLVYGLMSNIPVADKLTDLLSDIGGVAVVCLA